MNRAIKTTLLSIALSYAFTGHAADVKVITTTDDRRLDLAEEWIDFNHKSTPRSSVISIFPEERLQEIDGFGAAITGSTCYNLMHMSPSDRKAFLTQTFSESEGYGFSYCRISIGCSDFSLSEYTCCDTPGIENFALTSEETDLVIPVLNEILEINPNVKIMGSPWTPPRWMKVSLPDHITPHDKWTAGFVNPNFYADYASYFVKWIEAFGREGIKIYAITPQNEPLNPGNSASCLMPWEQQRDFIKTALGPALKKAGLDDVKIYAFDHNYNYDNIREASGYPTKIYADADAAKYIAGAAYHNYGGNKDELNTVHYANPDKELVFSETSIGTWNDGKNLSKRLIDDMNEVALGTVNRWCRGVMVWNLMLDADRGPNRTGGCQTCYGAVDIDKDYATITRNSHYYIIAHMSSVVKPGAVRIASEGASTKGITYSAFQNADGSYALVACNPLREAIEITVKDDAHQFTHSIPARSVASFSWNAKH